MLSLIHLFYLLHVFYYSTYTFHFKGGSMCQLTWKKISTLSSKIFDVLKTE